jgi:diguanylate cyclase
MQYSSPIDLARTRVFAGQALEAMQAYDVPPTPKNYEIWYAQVASSSAELTAALAAVFADGGEWSEEVGAEIHDQFFPLPNDPEAIAAIGHALGKEIASIQQTVEQAGQHTKSYGNALEAVSGQMDRGLDGNTLRAVVHQLAAATRSMRSRAETLENRLSLASTEIDGLRSKMEVVRQEARTDGLTSLANRKHFDERLAEAVAEAGAGGQPLCIVMGDIDHFKSFNDTWGHQTGDQVLRLVGSCFAENVKGRDTAARYGGEEFAVILPETSLANARTLAEQIRRNVQTKKVVKRSSGETLGSITISLGVAMLGPNDTASEVLRRADSCLYAAKRSGRNMVVTEEQIGAVPQPRTSAA